MADYKVKATPSICGQRLAQPASVPSDFAVAQKLQCILRL